MTKRHVLVVGYPKSGNTWLTRLTAELLGAPVMGFWKEPHNNDVAIEGQGRLSDIQVFKGHHSYGSMRRDFSLADIVYVVRDVRDVAISGANFFSFRPPSWLGKVTHSTRRLLPAARKEWLESVRLCRMILTLADGNREVNPWCAQAWDEHIYAYLDAGACVIRYEDLLAQPESECRRLLAHFGVERSAAQIGNAIANQSFRAAKKRSWSRATRSVRTSCARAAPARGGTSSAPRSANSAASGSARCCRPWGIPPRTARCPLIGWGSTSRVSTSRSTSES